MVQLQQYDNVSVMVLNSFLCAVCLEFEHATFQFLDYRVVMRSLPM